MALIPWTEELSVGIPEIDSQHQKLVTAINELHEAIATGRGHEELERIVDELLAYARDHFGYEEALFTRFGYKEGPAHCCQHAAFTKKIGELKSDIDADKTALADELLAFLLRWFADHIQRSDTRYVGCFHEHGMK